MASSGSGRRNPSGAVNLLSHRLRVLLVILISVDNAESWGGGRYRPARELPCRPPANSSECTFPQSLCIKVVSWMMRLAVFSLSRLSVNSFSTNNITIWWSGISIVWCFSACRLSFSCLSNRRNSISCDLVMFQVRGSIRARPSQPYWSQA